MQLERNLYYALHILSCLSLKGITSNTAALMYKLFAVSSADPQMRIRPSAIGSPKAPAEVKESPS